MDHYETKENLEPKDCLVSASPPPSSSCQLQHAREHLSKPPQQPLTASELRQTLPQLCRYLRPVAATDTDRTVVANLHRAQTFKRQQSEERFRLSLVDPCPDKRRSASADRFPSSLHRRPNSAPNFPPLRASAARTAWVDAIDAFRSSGSRSAPVAADGHDAPTEPYSGKPPTVADIINGAPSYLTKTGAHATLRTSHRSLSTMDDELRKIWILNLSMHFRDRSSREKFFVTYRETDRLWRRVTVSVDYRHAPPQSLEADLARTRHQRDKNAKIYDVLRRYLSDIEFYDTVTNLKLKTVDGQLHVHVFEDGNVSQLILSWLVPLLNPVSVLASNSRSIRRSSTTLTSVK